MDDEFTENFMHFLLMNKISLSPSNNELVEQNVFIGAIYTVVGPIDSNLGGGAHNFDMLWLPKELHYIKHSKLSHLHEAGIS